MSNPNTNVLARSLRNRGNLAEASSSSMKVVYVGKDMQPVTISKIKSLNSPSWQKSACFSSLFNTVSSLFSAHSVADLISLVSTELPLDTTAAYQEAQSASKDVLDSLIKIDHLEPLAFLNSSGASVSMTDFSDLEKRPSDVSYVRFRCSANGHLIDSRLVTSPDLSFSFCLKLPMYEYDDASKTASLVAHPSPCKGTVKAGVARSLSSCFNAATPNSPNTSPISKVATSSFSSPAMKNFMASRTMSSGLKRGYYGDCKFLDTQYDFDQAFGLTPTLLPENPNNSNYSSCQKLLREYGEKGKLDIFLHLCKLNYVGHDKVDTALNTQEICSKISSLRQVYRLGSRDYVDTPEELFDKFNQLSVGLPDDVKKWSIQLCSTFFSALSKDLVEDMTADKNFRMPDLTTLTTKALQLEALRSVRTEASKSFKSLSKQKDLMSKLLRSLHPSHSRSSNMFFGSNREHPLDDSRTEDNGQMLQYQNGQSPAESTIRRYSSNMANNFDDKNEAKVPTKLCEKTGLQHPYDKETNYISRFPVGFRGCFNCGATDHFSTRDCPAAQSGNFNKRKFFAELWAHKPHTRKFDFNRQPMQSNLGSQQNYSTNGNPSPDIQISNQPHFSESFNHHQRSDQNLNAIGNDGFADQRVTDNNCNLKTDKNSGIPRTNDSTIKQERGKNDLSKYQNPSHSNPRNVDNTPSWMKKKDEKSKKPRLFTLTGLLMNVASSPELRAMPLPLDNALPATVFRFGTDSSNEIPFSCHLDSCAAMNTGNLRLHQWIITKYPHIVEKYEQYDDVKPFRPITLDCALPASEAEKTAGKLTAVVTYKTRYFDSQGKKLTLSFGLGESIQVNAIIGLPTIKEWKLVLDVDGKIATSKEIGIDFDLCFQHAATGFPEGISFDPATFVRPQQVTNMGLSLLAKAASVTFNLENVDKPVPSVNIELDECGSLDTE